MTDLDQLKRRHPAVFAPSIGQRFGGPIAAAAVGLSLIGGLWQLGFSPGRIADGMGQLGVLLGLMFPPDPGSLARAMIYLKALGETVAIAFLGTFGAAVLALPVGLLAAKNVVANRILHFLARRTLDSVRGVDTLIWALIWINVVGLGPFAGVLAILIADLATFGKLFSEAIEAADKRPIEGVLSTGGSSLHRIRFGILPGVFPVMLGQVLYFFESNTRSATIIGIVGAGGIGMHLAEQIRTLEFGHVAFIVISILCAVALIDAISSRLRFAIIGKRQVPVD